MMKRQTAASYCDLSVGAFEREIAAGRLPAPVMLGGREHWCKNALDRALDQLTGGEQVPDYRKNAVNALLEAGCTIAEVSAITGQTHQVVEHYAAKVNRRKLGKAAIVKFAAARKK